MGGLGCSGTVTFVGVASSGDTASLEVDSAAVTAAVVSSCKDTIGIASSIGGDSIITIDDSSMVDDFVSKTVVLPSCNTIGDNTINSDDVSCSSLLLLVVASNFCVPRIVKNSAESWATVASTSSTFVSNRSSYDGVGYNDAFSVLTDIVESVAVKLGQSSVTTETILSSLITLSSIAATSALAAVGGGASAELSVSTVGKASSVGCSFEIEDDVFSGVASSSMASNITDRCALLSFVFISIISSPLRVGVCSKLLLLSLDVLLIGTADVDDRLELSSGWQSDVIANTSRRTLESIDSSVMIDNTDSSSTLLLLFVIINLYLFIQALSVADCTHSTSAFLAHQSITQPLARRSFPDDGLKQPHFKHGTLDVVKT